MNQIREMLREAITYLKGRDPQDNFKILEESKERYKVAVLWEADNEEIIDIKINAKDTS